MRLAVLISGYIILAYGTVVVLNLISANDSSAGVTFVGLVIFSVPIVLSLIYAHGQRDKK